MLPTMLATVPTPAMVQAPARPTILQPVLRARMPISATVMKRAMPAASVQAAHHLLATTACTAMVMKRAMPASVVKTAAQDLRLMTASIAPSTLAMKTQTEPHILQMTVCVPMTATAAPKKRATFPRVALPHRTTVCAPVLRTRSVTTPVLASVAAETAPVALTRKSPKAAPALSPRQMSVRPVVRASSV